MTLLDYISQIGGLLGLFIGFSVISAIEIAYWLTFRFSRNLIGQKKSADKISPAIYDPPSHSEARRSINLMDKKLMSLKSVEGQA